MHCNRQGHKKYEFGLEVGGRLKKQLGRQRPCAYAQRQPGQYVCAPFGFKLD